RPELPRRAMAGCTRSPADRQRVAKAPGKRPARSTEQGLLLETIQGVTRRSRLLELQIAGVVSHGLLETADFARQKFVIGQNLRRHAVIGLGLGGCEHAVDEFANPLADTSSGNAVTLIEFELLGAAALGLADGAVHGIGDLVGIQYGFAVEVARRAADRLDEEI